MPRTAGGLIAFILAAVVSTVIGMWVMNRVGFLQSIVAKKVA